MALIDSETTQTDLDLSNPLDYEESSDLNFNPSSVSQTTEYAVGSEDCITIPTSQITGNTQMAIFRGLFESDNVLDVGSEGGIQIPKSQLPNGFGMAAFAHLFDPETGLDGNHQLILSSYSEPF